MRLLRSFPVLTFTLVLLSIVALCVAQQSVGLLLVAGALAAISWYLTEGPRGRSLPQWVSNLLVIALSLHVISELIQKNDDVRYVLGHFALWLTLIKLYERRTPRVHAHLLVLSMLLMLVGCLHSADLLFGILLFVYAVLGVYVLLLYQLYSAYEQSRAERVAAMPEDFRLAPLVKPIIGRRLGLQFRGVVATIAVAGLLLSALAFVTFPRGIGESIFGGMPKPTARQHSRFSPEVNLVQGGLITDSRRPVMNIQLFDQRGRPYRAGEPLLMRGAVLDRYDGEGRWRAGDRGSMPTQSSAEHPVPLGLTRLGEPPPVTLVVDFVQESSTLFSPYAPIAVTTDRGQSLRFEPSTLILSVDRDQTPVRWYQVQVDPAPTDERLEELTGGSMVHAASLRRLRNPIVAELARSLLRDAGIAETPPVDGLASRWHWNRDVARAFSRFLQSPAFEYTLDLGGVTLPTRDQKLVDPIEYFLTELKRGHCEYFASALVSMCANVGVDARLVTGYVAYTFDEASQEYLVLERNAHAWAEVRTGATRWATFDPTPPAVLRELHDTGATVADRLRWMYDRFDGVWSRTVVGFNESSQNQLADQWDSAWTARFSRMYSSIREWLRAVNRSFYLGPAGYLYVAFVTVVAVFAMIVLVRVMRRVLAIRRTLRLNHLRGPEHQRMVRQLGFYLDMLRVLRRGGVEKPAWQPPLLFARALLAENPAIGDTVRRLTELFYAGRYGRRPLAPQQVREAESLVRELATTLRVRH